MPNPTSSITGNSIYQTALATINRPESTPEEVILATMNMQRLLESTTQEYQNNAFATVLKKPDNFNTLTEDDKNNPALAYHAVFRHTSNFAHVSNELKNNRGFVESVIIAKTGSHWSGKTVILENIADELANNPDFIQWVLDTITLESLEGKVANFIYQDKGLFLQALRYGLQQDLAYFCKGQKFTPEKCSNDLLENEELKPILEQLKKSTELYNTSRSFHNTGQIFTGIYMGSVLPLLVFLTAFVASPILLPFLIATAGIFVLTLGLAITMCKVANHFLEKAEAEQQSVLELIDSQLAEIKEQEEARSDHHAPVGAAASSSAVPIINSRETDTSGASNHTPKTPSFFPIMTEKQQDVTAEQPTQLNNHSLSMVE